MFHIRVDRERPAGTVICCKSDYNSGCGTPGQILTGGLPLRRRLLCTAELRGHKGVFPFFSREYTSSGILSADVGIPFTEIGILSADCDFVL